MPNWGQIEIAFWRFKGKRAARGKGMLDERLLRADEVPERALKGRAVDMAAMYVSCIVDMTAADVYRLDAPTTVKAPRTWRGKKLGDRPLVTFVFRYRSEGRCPPGSIVSC